MIGILIWLIIVGIFFVIGRLIIKACGWPNDVQTIWMLFCLLFLLLVLLNAFGVFTGLPRLR